MHLGSRASSLVLLALLVMLAACQDRVPAPLQTPAGGRPIQRIDGIDVDVHGQVTVDRSTASIEAFDDFFAPTIFSGPPGKRILFLLRNGGERLHNFSIPGVGLDIELPRGDIREVSLTFPTTSAVVVFFCKYHRDSASMLGALMKL